VLVHPIRPAWVTDFVSEVDNGFHVGLLCFLCWLLF
jgi:hypothetical protein